MSPIFLGILIKGDIRLAGKAHTNLNVSVTFPANPTHSCIDKLTRLDLENRIAYFHARAR